MNTRARVKAVPVLLAASLGLGNLTKALAHEGHVQASLQPAGLEEIVLIVEEAGVTGMPESIVAGRYLVKVSGPEPGEMGPSGAVFVQFPEGVTAESAYEDVMSNPDGMPSWYLEAHFGGGVVLSQGTESWAVLDFTPGTWVVTTVFGTTLGVEFDVTGELPADLPEVEANVSMDLLEMVIHITEGEFVAGENVVYLNNGGAQLHFVDVSRVPDGTTKEAVTSALEGMMMGSPPAEGGIQESDFVPVSYMADISPGVHQYLPLTLEPGTYWLACFAPDPASGAPHAMMGMHEIIVVK